MEKINKKGFAILPLISIIAVILVVAGGGVYLYKKSNIENKKEVAEQQVATSTQSVTNETANWLVYKNDKYGFELTFNNLWKDYKITAHSFNDQESDICFWFERPHSIPACILKIGVFTPDQWKNLKNEVGYSVNFLIKNSQFYFSDNTSGGYEKGCAQLDEFQCARSKEKDQILSTFKFIK